MKNKIILISAFIIFVLSTASTVFADTTINLKIKTNTKTIFDNTIKVTPCDSDNDPNTPKIATPYCAIQQSGIANTWDWKWAPGAFVTSIDGVSGSVTKDKNGKDVYHYWSWSLNGSMSMDALNKYELKENNNVLLEFIDPVEEIIPLITKELIEAPVVHHSSGGYVSRLVANNPIKKVFSTENALKFLETNQKSDGSYGDPLYTDWVAVGVAGNDNKNIKENLVKYLENSNLETSLVTDNERRAMALMALNINPYNGTKVDYLKKITDSFDGTQFGDKNLVNDDIFALIVLKNVGYGLNDELITKDISYIISKQDKDGSWGSIDMTVAGIEALKSFENITSVSDSISKGEKYITVNQKTDGGFGNSFATSWALQTLFENKDILKGENYLASKQDTDGGVENIGDDINTRIWATAYAIPAILHKPWGEILNKFNKPEAVGILTPDNKVETKKFSKINSKILSGEKSGILKKVEDKRKIENLIDSNGATKDKKSSNIWSAIKAPFSWLFVKLGF